MSDVVDSGTAAAPVAFGQLDELNAGMLDYLFGLIPHLLRVPDGIVMNTRCYFSAWMVRRTLPFRRIRDLRTFVAEAFCLFPYSGSC